MVTHPPIETIKCPHRMPYQYMCTERDNDPCSEDNTITSYTNDYIIIQRTCVHLLQSAVNCHLFKHACIITSACDKELHVQYECIYAMHANCVQIELRCRCRVIVASGIW